NLVLPDSPGALAGAVQGARDLRASAAKPADALLSGLMKKTGLDPDAISLQATRMRMQAARSRSRQLQLAQDLAQAHGPIASEFQGAIANTPAPAPVVTPPAAPPNAALANAVSVTAQGRTPAEVA